MFPIARTPQKQLSTYILVRDVMEARIERHESVTKRHQRMLRATSNQQTETCNFYCYSVKLNLKKIKKIGGIKMKHLNKF